MKHGCISTRSMDTRLINPSFFATHIHIPIPNKYLESGYKGLVFCRNNGWIMENMDKGLTVPKLVLIVWPKILQMPQNLSAQFICPSTKDLDFNEKRLYWASVVREWPHSWSVHKLIRPCTLLILVCMKSKTINKHFDQSLRKKSRCSALEMINHQR